MKKSLIILSPPALIVASLALAAASGGAAAMSVAPVLDDVECGEDGPGWSFPEGTLCEPGFGPNPTKAKEAAFDAMFDDECLECEDEEAQGCEESYSWRNGNASWTDPDPQPLPGVSPTTYMITPHIPPGGVSGKVECWDCFIVTPPDEG